MGAWLVGLGVLFTGLLLKKGSRVGPSIIVRDEAVLGYRPFDVQRFLESRGSFLARYRVPGTRSIGGPRGKLASRVIQETAEFFDVKPEYLLVTLQRENGLIEGSHAKSPSGDQLDWAAGYGVPDTGGRDTRFKGFLAQVRAAGASVRGGLVGKIKVSSSASKANVQVGARKDLLDGWAVPNNRSTAFFYAYTPHVDAANLTQSLFQKWGFA